MHRVSEISFVFATVFLIFWCLPMTAVLIQIGSDAVATRESEQARRVMRRIAEISLVSGAGFFLAYGLWIGALSLGHPAMPRFELLFDSGLVLIFAANAFGNAVKVRSSSSEFAWMTGVFLAVAALVASHVIAIISFGLQGGLAPFAAPALLWIAVLAWSLRRWRRARLARLPVERGNRADVG